MESLMSAVCLYETRSVIILVPLENKGRFNKFVYSASHKNRQGPDSSLNDFVSLEMTEIKSSHFDFVPISYKHRLETTI